MNYKLEFEIPDLPGTTNSFNRQHWTYKWRESKKWHRLMIETTHALKPPKPLNKARLTLTRCSARCPDSDGLVSSFKYVIDGLIEAKVLNGDSYEHIKMPEYRWEKAPPKKGKIKISVEETE